MKKLIAAILILVASFFMAPVANAMGNNDEALEALNRKIGALEVRMVKVERYEARLSYLESRVRGMQLVTGALAEAIGIDQDSKPIVVTGFATGSAKLTAKMKKHLDEVATTMVESGRPINYVSAFADPRSWVDKNTGEDKNAALAEARGKAGIDYLAGKLGVDPKSIQQVLRGKTNKFGDEDLNRSLLVVLGTPTR